MGVLECQACKSINNASQCREMAEEKAKRFIDSSSNVDSGAYSANYGAHRVGISMQESVDYYSKWAQDGKYEQDLSLERYNGPIIAANYLADHYPDNRSSTKILDVAAGTGYVGEQLHTRGFKSVDALEPASGMLEQARKKNVYTDLYCEFLNSKRLPIKDDTYDCCVISGGMGEGHIPCDGLHELIRITKPGGLVCIVMREEYLSYVGEYKDRLEPLMQELEDAGKWEQLSRDVVPKYSFDNNGVVYKFKIC
ncbi:methyltransferase-like protein 27 isoform X2 [Haliotis rubra]|uniref:methyltransferase-like protein 27 isoform X2 n=1 Tax=Haliotis rubra TaxID=36100 RepID=UPI001EE5D6E2|nr:methyltransferase-like protein 27 isoform X2 [Haliotis rubra]